MTLRRFPLKLGFGQFPLVTGGSLSPEVQLLPVAVAAPGPYADQPRVGYPWQLLQLTLPIVMNADYGGAPSPGAAQSFPGTLLLRSNGADVWSYPLTILTRNQASAPTLSFQGQLQLVTDFNNPIPYAAGQSLDWFFSFQNPSGASINSASVFIGAVNAAGSYNTFLPRPGYITYEIPDLDETPRRPARRRDQDGWLLPTPVAGRSANDPAYRE